jgi:hypothetical protein
MNLDNEIKIATELLDTANSEFIEKALFRAIPALLEAAQIRLKKEGDDDAEEGILSLFVDSLGQAYGLEEIARSARVKLVEERDQEKEEDGA